MRDWGHAKDFVEMQWLMLQQDEPDDYVIATGEQHSVREFVDIAARELGIAINWEGEGVNEKGINAANGKTIIAVDTRYFRPTEVDTLLGDSSKGKKNLAGNQRSVLQTLSEKWSRLTWRRLRKMNCAKEQDFKFITTMSKVIKNSKIYVAGHRGLVGSALIRKLQSEGFTNILCRTHAELDLTRQDSVEAFFKEEKPEYVFLAAAKVGGIWGNNMYPAEYIYNNLTIQNNIIQASYINNVKKLLFLGSSCIYPKHCPQPMKEEYLLSGYPEPTNEPYAIAKIAGIKMCQSYNRQYSTNYISVMPTNFYGQNDNFDLETSHVLPALIRKFHLAKLAAEGHWDDIQKDEQIFGPIPDIIKESLGINPSTNKPLNQK